jgi:hypothetical protein
VGSIPIARSTFRRLAYPYVLKIRPSLLSCSHSLDAGPTGLLINSVDPPAGRVRSRWSPPSAADPFLLMEGRCFRVRKIGEAREGAAIH